MNLYTWYLGFVDIQWHQSSETAYFPNTRGELHIWSLSEVQRPTAPGVGGELWSDAPNGLIIMHITWASSLGVEPGAVHQEASSVQNIMKQKLQVTFILGNWCPAKASLRETLKSEVVENQYEPQDFSNLWSIPYSFPLEVTFSFWFTIIGSNDSFSFPFHRVKERKQQILLHQDRTFLTEAKRMSPSTTPASFSPHSIWSKVCTNNWTVY